MLRTIRLILRNEFRLLLQDRAALFMLSLAPIVIIAVSGLSLGSMFGVRTTRNQFLIPIVDEDHGSVAKAVIRGLDRETALQVVIVPDEQAARNLVTRNDDSPLAIIIPPGTTAIVKAGHTAFISLYVDPVKRIEASALELRLRELSQQVAAHARQEAQAQLAEASADLHKQVDGVVKQVSNLQTEVAAYQREIRKSRSALLDMLESQIKERMSQIKAKTQAAIDRQVAAERLKLQGELSRKQAAMSAVVVYLRNLQSSQRSLEQWFAQLRSIAGSHADKIPAPPSWPARPSDEQFAELSRPVDLSFVKPDLKMAEVDTDLQINLPDVRMPPMPTMPLNLHALLPGREPILPGDIGWQDRSLAPGYAEVNSFDQYVPGFGVTFLLLDVLWGVAVGLIDERDWGTLQRLRASGAPVSAMMIGKLSARFLVGFVQMIVLFSVGWMVFGIRLGANPLMLLLPTAAIAFAGAAFGLVIAGVARTRDSVLPIGSVAAMTMSAIGGCWWPINFEPQWMRSLALGMPTTWTMRAYNDLMIRGLDPAYAVWPSLVTLGLGLAFLIAGALTASRIYQ